MEERKALKFRNLNASEIECRVGTVTDTGCSLLMYKDARVDMRLLDEVVGATNWKREHQLINGNLFCTVSLWDGEKQEWVSKQDVGVESNTEKEKGQASDAFKRACFNWGIGRELYTCPFVWINLGKEEWRRGANGKNVPKTRFYVRDIEYKDGVVTYLRIVDDKNVERYKFGNSDELLRVCDEIKGASDVKALEAIYRKYEKKYSRDNTFLSAVTERKNYLTAA